MADVICLCPHLLGFKPEEVFGGVLEALERSVGIGREDVRQMVSSSVAFLVTPSAAAGVQAALECLLAAGFTREQVPYIGQEYGDWKGVKAVHCLESHLRTLGSGGGEVVL